MKSINLIILISLIFSNAEYHIADNILIKINERIITKNEFIKRAEYTIRPSYCRLDNNIHKKIILNSLIAEKLMAIEIENNLLSENFSSNFLEGIKEQKMRETLLKEEVYDIIELDSTLIISHFSNSSKKYDIQFLSLNNDSLAIKVKTFINDGVTFEDICYNYLNLKVIPSREIGYFEENDPTIHNAIFSNEIDKNQLLGPIYSKNGKVLFIKIMGWKNTLPITNQEKLNQLDLVKKKLYENAFIKGYDLYVQETMAGMNLSFFEESFFILAQETFNSISYKNDSNLNKLTFLNDASIINPDTEFIKLNEKIYTVEEIDKLIKKHPLVFRNNNIDKKNYVEQFKYAIVDLIRDEKLNDIAYRKNYNNHKDVIKEVEIYRDAALSNLHLQTYLQGKNISIENFNEHYLDILNEDLNEYISHLTQKYSDEILINFNLLDKIKLTHIDLYAYRKGVPYPSIVPTFPILISKYNIDYGVKLDLQ